MTIVVDASAVVAALIDPGPTGVWAESLLVSGSFAAPYLMTVEAATILRRAAIVGRISNDAASLAHRDLVALRVDLHPYSPFASRIWELRNNVTPYDAWYVAVAEGLGAPLATLDARLRRATGPRCEFSDLPADSI